jgi:predicted kinase
MLSMIILVCGYPASGKSLVGKQLARRLACCYLDKDTMTSPFADRLLLALGQPVGDRDSEVYRREVRPLEYECLLAVGFETAEAGVAVVLSAPFIGQLVDADWMSRLRHTADARELDLKIVWVHCDRSRLFQRMALRASPRDRAKLSSWTAYAAKLDEQLPRHISGECFLFDNSIDAAFDAEMDRLVNYLGRMDGRRVISTTDLFQR